MSYHQPDSLCDALKLAAETGVQVIAGGTDVFPAQGDGPPGDNLLDITRLPELRGVTKTPTGWRLGATTSWTEVQKAPLPPGFDGLKQAAREVGAWQIQNAGTVAGNLCNASPAADGVPPLLTLEAELDLSSATGTRRLPLSDFITGVRQTALRPGEIVTALQIPAMPDGARSRFMKLGARKYLVISIAMASALICCDRQGRIETARIAVGSCSAVAQRLRGLETALIGQGAQDIENQPGLFMDHLDVLTPITDIRGSGAYRRDAAAELSRRVVLSCLRGDYG